MDGITVDVVDVVDEVVVVSGRVEVVVEVDEVVVVDDAVVEDAGAKVVEVDAEDVAGGAPSFGALMHPHISSMAQASISRRIVYNQVQP